MKIMSWNIFLKLEHLKITTKSATNTYLVPIWERSLSRVYIATLFINLYAGYIMQNARLNEAQAGIKIARRNINNLIYADDTILMAESEEELKRLLMKVKEESEELA